MAIAIDRDQDGSYQRQPSRFRNWVTPRGTPGHIGGRFAPQSGRYHLYVALLCPWAARTLIARDLKKLESHVSVSILEPFIRPEGWRFGTYPGATGDDINGAATLREIYELAEPGYAGRATVPVLWDRKRRTIVSNESADILRMFDRGFGELATSEVILCPADLEDEIDAVNHCVYAGLSNAVYRAGFARSQEAYHEAVADVFATLDALEIRLASRSFLVGERLTEADVRLFPTLVRFDLAYHGLFKCNLKQLADYPAVSAYLERLLGVPAFSRSVNVDHIKRGYYSMATLNPSQIVPAGPWMPWLERLAVDQPSGSDAFLNSSVSTPAKPQFSSSTSSITM